MQVPPRVAGRAAGVATGGRPQDRWSGQAEATACHFVAGWYAAFYTGAFRQTPAKDSTPGNGTGFNGHTPFGVLCADQLRLLQEQGGKGLLIDDFILQQVLCQDFKLVTMFCKNLIGPPVHVLDNGLRFLFDALGHGFTID
jgi:hypothetical protein